MGSARANEHVMTRNEREVIKLAKRLTEGHAPTRVREADESDWGECEWRLRNDLRVTKIEDEGRVAWNIATNGVDD